MELKDVDMKIIKANPRQPRQEFDREKLDELTQSIKEAGLLEPIVIRPKDDQMEIVAGERRFKAYQILKKKNIPSIIRDDLKDDIDALEKSLIENLQRDDLTSVERENAVYDLWSSGRYKTKRELGEKLGYDSRRVGENIEAYEFRKKIPDTGVSTVTLIDTKTLPENVRKKIIKQVDEKKLNVDKVRDVVRKVKEFSEPEQQMEELDRIVKRKEDAEAYEEQGFENDLDITKGKLHPFIVTSQNKYEAFVDEMENDFSKVKSYGVANIASLPKVHKDRAVDIITGTIGYLLQELEKIDEKKFKQLSKGVD